MGSAFKKLFEKLLVEIDMLLRRARANEYGFMGPAMALWDLALAVALLE